MKKLTRRLKKKIPSEFQSDIFDRGLTRFGAYVLVNRKEQFVVLKSVEKKREEFVESVLQNRGFGECEVSSSKYCIPCTLEAKN